MKTKSDALVTSSPLMFIIFTLAFLAGETFFTPGFSVIAILSILAFALVIQTLDDLQKGSKPFWGKITWGFFIFVLPIIGPFLYLLICKENFS